MHVRERTSHDVHSQGAFGHVRQVEAEDVVPDPHIRVAHDLSEHVEEIPLAVAPPHVTVVRGVGFLQAEHHIHVRRCLAHSLEGDANLKDLVFVDVRIGESLTAHALNVKRRLHERGDRDHSLAGTNVVHRLRHQLQLTVRAK